LKFKLTNDLNLAAEPDFYIPYLAGEFDGAGYAISNLSFSSDFVSQVGLFGYLAPVGRVTGVGVENVNITGDRYVGSLVGVSYEGTVSNSHSTGSVTGYCNVGGLVGLNRGTLSDSYSTGSVTGEWDVGGLVGWSYGNVNNSYSTGNVTANSGVGGLVGRHTIGTVSNSYATGSVTGGEDDVGGLVGWSYGNVNNSYSTGSVTGNSSVGGLVGRHTAGTVSNSYATGNVTGGGFYAGGLVGHNDDDGTVSNSYSTGNVTGSSDVGGLVGENSGTVSNSFWDTETSGQYTSDGGTGKTTAQMQVIATFSGAGWNITTVDNPGIRNPSYIWNIATTPPTYPFLSWQPIL
jgi:hypothetical protein